MGPRSPCKAAVIRGRTCPGMPNDTLPWAAQKWLNRSIFRLVCGLSLAEGSSVQSYSPMCPSGRAHWRHLANTIEPLSTATIRCLQRRLALRQITLSTCCGLQQTYPPLTEQASQPYSGRTGSYDDSLAAAEDQENFEYVRQMDEFGESTRERRRERDRDKERDRDSDRDWDQSRRHRSGDRWVIMHWDRTFGTAVISFWFWSFESTS